MTDTVAENEADHVIDPETEIAIVTEDPGDHGLDQDHEEDVLGHVTVNVTENVRRRRRKREKRIGNAESVDCHRLRKITLAVSNFLFQVSLTVTYLNL